MKMFAKIDENGFFDGTLSELVVNDRNRGILVDTLPPDEEPAQFKSWRWVEGAWVQYSDYRGHFWYNPDDTKQWHKAARFDDAPPSDWVYWPPGENAVVKPSQARRDQWQEIRDKRDRLLADSDWVTVRSVDQGEPVPEAWLHYRQALRDITNQSDPFNINWPDSPA